MDFLIGRFNLDYLPSDIVTIIAAIGMPVGVLTILFLLWRFNRLKWLWDNWLISLDAKKIGVMYGVVAMLMLVRGFLDAVMMRVYTVLVSSGLMSSFDVETYQQVFTAHGTLMIFFVAMGLLFAITNAVLPLMIGARDVAFPLLNSISFWLFAAGMVLTNVSLIVGGFSAAGWLAFPPLSGLEYSPGPGVDYWIWALQISGVGSLLSGINFLVTIIKKRAPGMTLMKMPIFVWSILVTMVLVVVSFPILTATLGMLSLDRLMGMHYFTSDFGGNPMMYINLIWAWGHPEVYILVLPAFGIYSEIVSTYAKKKLFGYKTMVAALVAIMFFSFLVWLHHFFTMGSGANVNAFFGIMTMIISIPTGVKIFNWLFTMYKGKITFASPFVWFMCFVVTFTIGGVTGVMMAVPAIDFQVHNTLFLVAHFHNTIIGGVVFGFMAAITYWFPKIFGFKLHDGIGKIAAYLWQVGFILAFGPLYILGFMGAVRRMDSNFDPSWQPLFIVSFIGVCMIGLGVLAQVIQFAYSVWKRNSMIDKTGDPWDGRTLEWSTPSPAPEYNFALTPAVKYRDDWWYKKQNNEVKEPNVDDYVNIHMPKNTSTGLYIGVFAGLMGLGCVWHVWWLVCLMAGLIVYKVIMRVFDKNTEYEISADELYSADVKHYKKRNLKEV